jgi:hypothetical protein
MGSLTVKDLYTQLIKEAIENWYQNNK